MVDNKRFLPLSDLDALQELKRIFEGSLSTHDSLAYMIYEARVLAQAGGDYNTDKEEAYDAMSHVIINKGADLARHDPDAYRVFLENLLQPTNENNGFANRIWNVLTQKK